MSSGFISWCSKQIATGFIKLELETSFPVGEFILVFGFFIIFIVEQFILAVKESNPDRTLTPLLDGTDSISITSSVHENRASGEYGSMSSQPGNPLTLEEEAIEEVENEKVEYVDPNSQSVVRSLMLVCALSLHSFFEGLAIGLQVDTSDVLAIFLPVALHKSIIAFALGLSLAQSKLNVKAIVRSDFLFSVTSPVGIGIGTIIIAASSDNPDTAMINGILEGIACGTFLFVVFFEILPHEFMRKKKFPNRLLKTLFLILGFSVVTLILFIHPEKNPVCATVVKSNQ